MPTTSLIVLSDLHLADGHRVLEGFGTQQQAAFEGLLQAALSDNAAGDAAVELIINGDCFDFLAVPPYLESGLQTPSIALAKLEKIAHAHTPFFAALRDFRDQGGNVTFLPGNHDVELGFAEIRARISQLIAGQQGTILGIHFGLDQRYQPLSDVAIEHGHQYDFWNYAWGIWDGSGQALTDQPEQITLPLGTQYMQRAALPISIRYPYFDHFDPPLGTTRQLALLSLIDPQIVVETAIRTVRMMSYPYQALQGLAPGNELQPALLFEQAMPNFVAFQQDMLMSHPQWQTIEESITTLAERTESQNRLVAEYLALHAALETSPEATLKALFQPIEEADAFLNRGMHSVLRKQPDLRCTIAGHTHMVRWDQLQESSQIYLNTGSWTLHQALPDPEYITSEWLPWLRQPLQEPCPALDQTAYTFAWLRAGAGKISTIDLCVWEGGKSGNYRILQTTKE